MSRPVPNQHGGDRGLVCPSCGAERPGVYDSRPGIAFGVPAHRRRRRCESCGHKFTTFEIIATDVASIRNSSVKELVAKLMEEL